MTPPASKATRYPRAQQELGIPQGSIRATVLIETILAAFEMDEILYELRDHSAGMNCGRWDYIFSFIKKFRAHRDFMLPDRSSVTMDKAFLSAYVALLIRTCHHRGIHAMGGMAAQIPIRDDAAVNEAALGRVRQDKLREVRAGHDGTWVAHPALVPVAREIFESEMPEANQIGREREGVPIVSSDLLKVPEGAITESGVRQNISIGILYLEAWFGGLGCVPLNHLMEDAATAEISRVQLWQWLTHRASLADGRVFTIALYEELRDGEVAAIRQRLGEPRWSRGFATLAIALFDRMTRSHELADFLTVPAYDELLQLEGQGAG